MEKNINRRVRTSTITNYTFENAPYGFVTIYENGEGIYACMIYEL